VFGDGAREAVIDGAAQNPPPTPPSATPQSKPQSTPRPTSRPKRPAPDQGDLF
jgi:exodeoxyribonuclease VII large subunit